MSKWILATIVMIGLQVQAQVPAVESANPPAELTAIAPAPQASPQTVSESEIPVNLESSKKAESGESPLMKLVLSVSIVGVLASAAFFLLRKYRYTNPKSQATQIKVLSQHYLGPKKSLAIVRVAGESVLIGITDQNISMIKSLSLLDEDIPEETPAEFSKVFSKKNKVAEISEDPDNRDEFSISGIRDFVSVRLKNMRSFE